MVRRGALTLSLLALSALAGPARAQTATVALVVPACRSDADALVRAISEGSGAALVRRERARDDELTLEIDARVCAPGARVGLVVRVGDEVRLAREMVLDPATDPGRTEALVLTLAEWTRWALRDAAARGDERDDPAPDDAGPDDAGPDDGEPADAARDDTSPSEADDTATIEETAPDDEGGDVRSPASVEAPAVTSLAPPLAAVGPEAFDDRASEPSGGGGARALGSPFAEPAPRAFAIGASFIVRGHLDRGTLLLGGELRVRWPFASPFALHLGVALLGNDVPLASVGRAITTALGGVLGLGLTLLRLPWLELSIEAEISLAWTRISGATSDIGYVPASLDGSTLLAGGEAVVAFLADRSWDIELRLGGGGAIVSVAGDVDGRTGVGTGGGFLDARLGLALSL